MVKTMTKTPDSGEVGKIIFSIISLLAVLIRDQKKKLPSNKFKTAHQAIDENGNRLDF